MLAVDESKIMAYLGLGLVVAVAIIWSQKSEETKKGKHEADTKEREQAAMRIARSMSNQELRSVLATEATKHEWPKAPVFPSGPKHQSERIHEYSNRRSTLFDAVVDVFEERVKAMPTSELNAEIDDREVRDRKVRAQGSRDEVRCVLWRERSRRNEEDALRKARGDS